MLRAGLVRCQSDLACSRYADKVAYSAAKAGIDKLTADLAHELRTYDIAVVSLWPPLTTCACQKHDHMF